MRSGRRRGVGTRFDCRPGEPLPPKLEATAAGLRAGLIGDEQVKIIRDFFAALPCFVDEPERVKAEQDLAEVASRYRPDELKRFAEQLQTSPVISGHELPLLERLFRATCWPVRRVQF